MALKYVFGRARLERPTEASAMTSINCAPSRAAIDSRNVSLCIKRRRLLRSLRSPFVPLIVRLERSTFLPLNIDSCLFTGLLSPVDATIVPCRAQRISRRKIDVSECMCVYFAIDFRLFNAATHHSTSPPPPPSALALIFPERVKRHFGRKNHPLTTNALG